MWNDEEPREPDSGLQQVVSSWGLVAVLLIGTAGWSGIQYVSHGVVTFLVKDNELALPTVPTGMEVTRPAGFAVGHCHPATEQKLDGSAPTRQHVSTVDPPGLLPPNVGGCDRISVNSFDLPGNAIAIAWEDLR